MEVSDFAGKIEETRDFTVSLARSDDGFIVSARRKLRDTVFDFVGADLKPRHFKSHAAAQLEFDYQKALAMFWDAVVRREPRRHLLKEVGRLERLSRQSHDDHGMAP